MFLFSNLFSPCSKNHIYEKQTWNLFCVYFFFFFFFHHCSFCWSCMLAKSREHWYDKQKKTWIQSTKNKGEYSIKICLKKKKKRIFFFSLKESHYYLICFRSWAKWIYRLGTLLTDNHIEEPLLKLHCNIWFIICSIYGMILWMKYWFELEEFKYLQMYCLCIYVCTDTQTEIFVTCIKKSKAILTVYLYKLT